MLRILTKALATGDEERPAKGLREEVRIGNLNIQLHIIMPIELLVLARINK